MSIDRQQLRDLFGRTVPGPWRVQSIQGYSFAQILTDHPDYQDKPHQNCVAETNRPETSATAEFICLARQAMPALLDELEAAEARAAAAEAALRARE